MKFAQALLLIGGVAALAGWAGPLDASTTDLERVTKRNLSFAVFRAGKPLGSHRIAFTRKGQDLIVDVAIDLKVRFALITVFRYTHRNREVWRNGRLVSLRTRTNDDGKEFRVDGRATAAGFEVKTDKRTFVAPADIIPTSYWNPATPSARRLLNTQAGDILKVAATPKGEQTVRTKPGPVSARRYALRGGLDLDIWYDTQGRLAKIEFRAKSDQSLIDYERLD